VSVDLSVIIVNWNTRELLADCLCSIEDFQSSIFNLQSEVIVVDNASSDSSAAMVREQFPWVRLRENVGNVGFARANNQGISQATGRYVLLLNPDTVVMPGALAALVGFLEAHPQVGVVGPTLLDRDRRIQLSWAKFPTLWSELTTGHRRDRKPFLSGDAYEVDWLAGACLLVRRGAIDAAGLLDERFFLYSEETDWCLRIQRAGWRIAYYPSAKVVHLEGSSTALDRPRTSFLLCQSKVLYFDKHYGRTQAQLLRFGYITLAPMKALRAWLRGRPNTAVGHLRTARQLLSPKVFP
jgi:GT2 family glycosyltransferase